MEYLFLHFHQNAAESQYYKGDQSDINFLRVGENKNVCFHLDTSRFQVLLYCDWTDLQGMGRLVIGQDGRHLPVAGRQVLHLFLEVGECRWVWLMAGGWSNLPRAHGQVVERPMTSLFERQREEKVALVLGEERHQPLQQRAD